MTQVSDFIKSYGIKKFLSLNSREQNKKLYHEFPTIIKVTLRSNKASYLTKIIVDPDVVQQKKKSKIKAGCLSGSIPDTDGLNPSLGSTTSPPIPTSSAGGGGSPLNPYIQAIMDIQSAFTFKRLNCSVKDAIELKHQSDKLSSSGDRPPWHNPPVATLAQIEEFRENPALVTEFIASPKQMEIMNAVAYGPQKVIMIEGTKRTGKSTFVWLGINLAIWNGTHKRWRMYGASQDNAMDIHEGMKQDPLTFDYTKPLEKGDGSKLRTDFFNGGFLKVMSTGKGKGGERRSSGTDCDAVWIDESHSVLIQAPKTFAMSAMILLAQPNIRFVFSMNREGAAYEAFKNDVLGEIDPKDVKFITITQDDIFHITKQADKLVRVLVRASAGEDMVAQYMDNQFIRDGGLYYPTAKITKAYQSYESPKLEQYDMIACGVDWGDNHDTAMIVAGFLGEEVYEEESVYIQHPSSEELERVFVRLIREYPGIIFIWETSPLGSFARNSIRSHYPKTRFLDSSFTKYKQNYLDNLYIWLVDEEIHLKDGKLKRQIRSFVNDKKNDDGHDALCHLLYKAVKPRTRMKIQVIPVR